MNVSEFPVFSYSAEAHMQYGAFAGVAVWVAVKSGRLRATAAVWHSSSVVMGVAQDPLLCM